MLFSHRNRLKSIVSLYSDHIIAGEINLRYNIIKAGYRQKNRYGTKPGGLCSGWELKRRAFMKVIGIDIGTTSISSVVIEEDGLKQVASRTVPNDTAVTGEIWERQQDADKILEKCCCLIEEYKKEWKDSRRIGITGQMHGMLYVDSEGKALSPLTTWEDERGNREMENGYTYVRELQEKSGYPMATGFGLTTHFYNLKNGLVPEGAAYIVTIMDYVAMRLCGNSRPVMPASNAAGFGLFDLRRGKFDMEACRRAGIDPAILPETSGTEKFIGKTKDGLEVMIPIGDNQAGLLGLMENESDIVINIGTSSQVSMVSRTLPEDTQLECRPFVGGKYLLLGAGLCGGTSFAMLNSFFRAVAEGSGTTVTKEDMFRFMTESAGQAYENGSDLVVNTQFRGKRSDPSLRGSIGNISMTNLTPGGLVLGFYRGVLGELHEAYEKMMPGPESRLLLCGNALRNSALLRQLCGEMFGRKAVLSEQREETATGAAKLALMG